MRHKHGVLIIGVFLTLMASGCSQGGDGIALMEEPAAAEDSLTAADGDLEDSTLEAIQEDTARFVAEHDGISYFFAKPSDPAMRSGICIVAAEPGVIGCGGRASELTVSSAGWEAQSAPDGSDTTALTDEGWLEIHENLLVR